MSHKMLDIQPVEIEVVVHSESADSYYVSDTGHRKDAKWVPKSQVDLEDDVMTMPQWLAEKKGFV